MTRSFLLAFASLTKVLGKNATHTISSVYALVRSSFEETRVLNKKHWDVETPVKGLVDIALPF